MEHRMLYLPLVLLFLIGAFLLGKGITGFVVSQSCCFPPDCAPENMCPFARPYLESPTTGSADKIYLYPGGAIILISVILYVLLNRKIYFG